MYSEDADFEPTITATTLPKPTPPGKPGTPHTHIAMLLSYSTITLESLFLLFM